MCENDRVKAKNLGGLPCGSPPFFGEIKMKRNRRNIKKEKIKQGTVQFKCRDNVVDK